MSDLDQILDDAKPAEQPQETPEAAEETEAPEVADAANGVEDDPVAEIPEPIEEPVAEQSDAEKGLLAELTKLRHELREAKAQPAPEPQPLPDVIDDPSGYAQTIQSQVQQALQNERLNMSEAMARQTHGDAKVDAARDAILSAAQAGDVAALSAHQQIMRSANPYAELIKWHSQQEFSRRVGSDPEAFMAKERERIKAEVMAELEAQRTARVVKSAPSLAAETSIGGRNSATAPTLTPLDDILS